MISITAAASVPESGLARQHSACSDYFIRPTPAQSLADIALVTKASGRRTAPGDVGPVMAAVGWRIVWATPKDSEPGVFFFRGRPGAARLIDVWGGPTSDRKAAFRWAAERVGAPLAMARCFAAKVVSDGP